MTTLPGNNTIEINQSTAIAAFQLWADATFKDPPEITGVKASSEYGTNGFTISVQEIKSEQRETAR